VRSVQGLQAGNKEDTKHGGGRGGGGGGRKQKRHGKIEGGRGGEDTVEIEDENDSELRFVWWA